MEITSHPFDVCLLVFWPFTKQCFATFAQFHLSQFHFKVSTKHVIIIVVILAKLLLNVTRIFFIQPSHFQCTIHNTQYTIQKVQNSVLPKLLLIRIWCTSFWWIWTWFAFVIHLLITQAMLIRKFVAIDWIFVDRIHFVFWTMINWRESTAYCLRYKRSCHIRIAWHMIRLMETPSRTLSKSQQLSTILRICEHLKVLLVWIKCNLQKYEDNLNLWKNC